MVFSEGNIDIVKHGFSMNFMGLANLKWVFFIDPEFNRLLTEEVGRMLLIVPAVIIFSLFSALLLNQKFRGRGFVRAIFFLPVILYNALLSNMADIIK
jgi:ABC-type sugar transport system permease subunit